MIRVLLVDDYPAIRGVLRAALGLEPGFEIVGEAGNGREAVELTERLQPDLLLMDVKMPELSGVEAARRIKRDWPAIKVVLFTHTEPGLAQLEVNSGGADAFLPKGTPIDELVGRIRALLRAA
jgi:DNA-binding NarL/FixJ family response regulator